MANKWYEYLKRLVSVSDTDLLREAGLGLLDAGRFHCRKPITPVIAELLLKLSTLKVIQFHDLKPDRRTLNLLNEVVFKNRKDVTLRVYDHLNKWTDISFLADLPEVERFDWHTVVFGSPEPLYRLNRLVHLGLGFGQPKPKISLGFVKDFCDTLESLSIDGDYKDTLSVIPELRKLTSVWFTSTKLPAFDFLEGLRLETIGNYGSRVGSFEFLRQVATLKRVWLKNNPKLDNIDFIEDLRNLERIELQYLPKITRFPKCDHLKNLELIFAFECNGLADITEIIKLKGVRVSASGKALRGRLQGRGYVTPGFSMR